MVIRLYWCLLLLILMGNQLVPKDQILVHMRFSHDAYHGRVVGV